jgi:hypothetical protein
LYIWVSNSLVYAEMKISEVLKLGFISNLEIFHFSSLPLHKLRVPQYLKLVSWG